jgi:RNA polymerase sigma factor (sigma-70 family)
MEAHLDRYEDFEEEEKPSEDIAELHFRRIQAIPVLSEPEEEDLLKGWCKFRDEKAKDRIVRAHMRMVPPIAREAAYKAGFQPNHEMLPTAQRFVAAAGFAEVISDLTAAGNLGLVQAVGGYRLGQDVKFYTYARTCVMREVWEQATFLRSAVRRKDGSPALFDLSIDPLMPDVHDFRDYAGSQAHCLRPTAIDDKSTDWGLTGPSHSRLRVLEEEEPNEINMDHLPEQDRLLITARMRGIKLKKIAEALGVSVSTVWRKEKSAIARMQNL